MNKELRDVAIIGGGPAGLNAALVLGRARKKVAVIDAGSPRNAVASDYKGGYAYAFRSTHIRMDETFYHLHERTR